MPDAALAGLSFYLRKVNASGVETFTLYAGAGTPFSAEYRQKLMHVGIQYVYVRLADQVRLRRQLEEQLQSIARDRQTALALRCEIVYESSLELMDEMLASRTFKQSISRLNRIADAIVSLTLEDPMAFGCFMSAAHHDAYPATHAVNVAMAIPSLAAGLGVIKAADLNVLCLAGLLYDAGMAYMPESLLRKVGKFGVVEWRQIRQHSEVGSQLLRQFANLDPLIATIAVQHHERLDGSGYPRGLTFDRIHQASRMVSVIDTFDALTSFRPHRNKPMTPAAANDLLKRESPHRYDPSMVDAWIQLFKKYCPEMQADNQTTGAAETGEATQRRRFERFAIKCAVNGHVLSLISGIWTNQQPIQGMAHNLSRSGIGILTQKPLKPGDYVRATMAAKDGTFRNLEGIVVRERRCEDGWFEIGIRFLDLAAEASTLPNGEFVSAG